MGFYMNVVHRLRKGLFPKKRESERTFYQQIKQQFSNGGDLISVCDLLQTSAKMYANYVALIDVNKTLTYKEFFSQTINFSKKLAQNGVTFRDRVLLYHENSLEFYIFYFAIWQCGAVVVPVNTFLHEKELGYILKDSEPAVILTSSLLKEKINGLVSKGFVDRLPTILTEQDIDWQKSVPKNIENPFNEKLTIDELCLLLYTSGTTGVPKGVMLSSRNVITNMIQACVRMKTFSSSRERFFSVLPLFHVFAQNTCMWMPLVFGSSVIIVSKIDRGYILDGLKKKPTIFFGFPALYGLLCLMRTAPLGSIKRFISGADAMPDKIRSAFAMIYGRKICSGYGLTEASPVVAINQDNEELQTYVVGKPLLGIKCDVRDKEGKSLDKNKIGTLWIRGDNVMLGYYKSPKATAKILKKEWLCTGDLASIDNDGYLAIRGRSKDLIIHKGFNIYPQEVENVLLAHPAVFKAAVVGREETVVGQVPIAFVAVKDKQKNIESKLRILCANNLASYKVPRKFICVDDLPMNATGKVDKKQLSLM